MWDHANSLDVERIGKGLLKEAFSRRIASHKSLCLLKLTAVRRSAAAWRWRRKRFCKAPPICQQMHSARPRGLSREWDCAARPVTGPIDSRLMGKGMACPPRGSTAKGSEERCLQSTSSAQVGSMPETRHFRRRWSCPTATCCAPSVWAEGPPLRGGPTGLGRRMAARRGCWRAPSCRRRRSRTRPTP